MVLVLVATFASGIVAIALYGAVCFCGCVLIGFFLLSLCLSVFLFFESVFSKFAEFFQVHLVED